MSPILHVAVVHVRKAGALASDCCWTQRCISMISIQV